MGAGSEQCRGLWDADQQVSVLAGVVSVDGASGGPAVRLTDGAGPLAATAVRPQGLSLLHKWTATGGGEVDGSLVVSFAVGGEVCHTRRVTLDRPERGPSFGGSRGKCRGFSGASRRRILTLLQLIDGKAYQCHTFITCTVKAGTFGVGADAMAAMEKARRVWARFWRKKYPGVVVVWKKELHRSGTPHLHAIVFWPVGMVLPRWSSFRRWHDGVWASAARSVGAVVGKGACRCEGLRSKRGVMWYAAKYLAQEEDIGFPSGRIWGVLHRDAVKWSDVDGEVLDPVAGKLFVRACARLRLSRKAHRSFVQKRPSSGSEKCRWFSEREVRRLLVESSSDFRFWERFVWPGGGTPPPDGWPWISVPAFDRMRREMESAVTVREVDEFAERLQLRSKYRRRREHRNVKVKLWMVEEMPGRRAPRMVPGDDWGVPFEWVARTSSVTFGVSVEDVRRLVAWARREAFDRLASDDPPPF